MDDVPSHRILTYAGRLIDSRKGLELFLDALTLIWRIHPLPKIEAWILGGSTRDREWAIKSARSRTLLRDRIEAGELVFWGRIEGPALPEFYSRSTAVIVPSFREQFCIVAVEAMMCGSPVVAARVGGLQDVVVDGRTGILFDRGQVTALAAALISIIQAPALSKWLGRNAELWAHASFEEATVLGSLESLLREPRHYSCSRWSRDSESIFREILIKQSIPQIQAALKTDITSFRDLTSSQSISFAATLQDASQVFVKIYSDRPTFFSCLHSTVFPGNPSSVPRERLQLALQLDGESFFPRVLAHDTHKNLIVQEFISPMDIGSPEIAKTALRYAESAVRRFQPMAHSSAMRGEIQDFLATNTWRSFSLDAFDELVARLHSSLVQGPLRTRRMHPQVELIRIHRYLERHSFWLPTEYLVRAEAAISLFLESAPLIPAIPMFAHGTLKAEHLLGTDCLNPKLCDFDHSGYYCGRIDLAHWIWDLELQNNSGGHPKQMFNSLRAEAQRDEQELYLAASWILSFQLNRDIALASRGSLTPMKNTIAFLYEIPEALRDLLSIQSGGI